MLAETVEDEEPLESKMTRLTQDLKRHIKEGHDLEILIKTQFENLGYDI